MKLNIEIYILLILSGLLIIGGCTKYGHTLKKDRSYSSDVVVMPPSFMDDNKLDKKK